MYLVAAAAFSAVGAFAYWLEKRPRRKPPAPDLDGTETTIWKPYRTASARSSVAFLNHLASLQVELQRAATEEHWSIDWPAYEAAYAAARASLESHQYSKALGRIGACPRNPDDGPDAIPQAAPSPVKMGQTPQPAGREIGRLNGGQGLTACSLRPAVDFAARRGVAATGRLLCSLRAPSAAPWSAVWRWFCCMMIGLLLSAVYSHLSYRSIIGKLHYAFQRMPAEAGARRVARQSGIAAVDGRPRPRRPVTGFSGTNSAKSFMRRRRRRTVSCTVSRT